jgi:hypothetical protein
LHFDLRRAADSGGSRRFLGLLLGVEIGIPAPEGILPFFVEHAGSYLQEEMCSTLAPSRLLFLHHSPYWVPDFLEVDRAASLIETVRQDDQKFW